jgi:hypothetical protein
MIHDSPALCWSVLKRAGGNAGSMTEMASGPLGCQVIACWDYSGASKRVLLTIAWGGGLTGRGSGDSQIPLDKPV